MAAELGPGQHTHILSGRENMDTHTHTQTHMHTAPVNTHIHPPDQHTHTDPRQALTARYLAHTHADMHTCTPIHTHTQTSAHLPEECTVFVSFVVFPTPIV